MEDVVGILVTDRRRGRMGFMTWGRLFHPVDDAELLACIRAAAPGYGLHDIESIELCWSLRDLAGSEYFYEGLLHFAWQPIPFGPEYHAWRDEKVEALRAGREIYGLGRFETKADKLESP